MEHSYGKILLVRLDKIGDLCLTLPCSEHPGLVKLGLQPVWLIQKSTQFVFDQAHFQNKPACLTLDLNASMSQIFKQLDSLKKQLEEFKIEKVVIIQAPRWFYLWVWWQGFSFRAGRISHPIHRGALNAGIRQSRKSGQFSELEYNWDLLSLSLQKLQVKLAQAKEAKIHSDQLEGSLTAADFKPSELRLKSKPLRHLLEKHDLSPKDFFVVHPGMAGSAPNWPTRYFAELIQSLSKKKTVVITGTRSDDFYLKPLQSLLPNNSRILWLDGQLSSQELLYVLSQAACVIAGSTGVLHLAAGLETACLGFYAEEPQYHPLRWGPFKADRMMQEIDELTVLDSKNVKLLISTKSKRKKLEELDDLTVKTALEQMDQLVGNLSTSN